MNKSFLLAFCCVYFVSIHSCRPTELIVYSVGGSQVIGAFETPLNLPDREHFTGRQLCEANLGVDLDDFFAKIICEFGFKYDHPVHIKFTPFPESNTNFTCVNVPFWIVRVTENDGVKKIVLELEEVVTFNKFGHRCDIYKIIRYDAYSRLLPLFNFVGERLLQDNSECESKWIMAINFIMRSIGRGCTLQEYDALVRKHVPLKPIYFLQSMSVNHCVPMALFDKPKFFDSIEDAAAGLLAAAENPEIGNAHLSL